MEGVCRAISFPLGLYEIVCPAGHPGNDFIAVSRPSCVVAACIIIGRPNRARRMHIGHCFEFTSERIWINSLKGAARELNVLWFQWPTSLGHLLFVWVVLGFRQAPHVVSIGGA